MNEYLVEFIDGTTQMFKCRAIGPQGAVEQCYNAYDEGIEIVEVYLLTAVRGWTP